MRTRESAPRVWTAAAISERERFLADDPSLLVGYATALFPVLLQVHSATANAAVRQKCLSCVSKVILLHSAEGLETLLRYLPFASFIASLFSSQEAAQGLAALGIAERMKRVRRREREERHGHRHPPPVFDEPG